MVSDTDLAYMAGMIDGEGSIMISVSKKHGNLTSKLTVYNTNEPVIRWMSETFGGSVFKVGRPLRLKHRQEWAWSTVGNPAVAILKQVMPYLKIKRTLAELAIEAWENRCPTPIVDRRKPLPEEVVLKRMKYVAQARALVAA